MCFTSEHDVVLVSVRECRVLFDSSYRSEHFYAASEIDGEDAQAKVGLLFQFDIH